VDFLRPLAQQKEMQIAWSAPHAAVSILADPSRLQQAFFNLALNAFRAMKAGGVLTITVDRYEAAGRPSVAVAFVDQGTGIPAENWERIFEPGFSTQCGSPGLGLAVTRKVVEQHGGAIRVESQEGRGTAFTLTFPAAAQ
jgi:signal transduction histidine kinase